MIHVLILEDDVNSGKALEQILTGYSGDICVHSASSYNDAKTLLHTEVNYALFLLDVNLSEENHEDIGGILFARDVREQFRYTFTPIVMVTAVGEMEMQAYRELHCYQYIMKPYREEQVIEVVKKVLEKEKQKKPAVLIVKKDGVNYQMNCEDILYIEAIHRGICIHMKDKEWKIPYIGLKQIKKKLPGDMFFQCHRMFVVNRGKIEYFDVVNRIIKLKGCENMVEIGVTYKAEIGRLLSD